MKRIEPVESVGESGYPSAREAGVDRRSFLRVLVASGGAAAGSLVLGEDRALARGVAVRPRYRVAIDLKPAVTYKGCKSAIVQIVATTRDYYVHRFLASKAERAGVVAAVRQVLLKARCSDLSGSRRYALGRQVTDALRKRYKRRTGRLAGRCWAVVVTKPSK